MAEGVLGLGSGGAASLNQEVIDKLKAAEKKATVEPIDFKLEAWVEEDEKMTVIKTKALELLEGIKPFDLYAGSGHQFEQMSATTTGTAATFNANDTSGLNPGTTTVNVSQLAQRDVYQTSTFTNKDAQVADGDDDGDMITIQVSGHPMYQSTVTSTSTDSDLVGAGEFTIEVDGGDTVTFTTTDETTWSQLQTMIHEDTNFKANIVNNRISISSNDGDKALTIADTSGTVMGDLDMTRGRKFTTKGQTYDQLATAINYDGKLTGSVEKVGDENYRLVIKGSDTGATNALTISQTGVALGIGETLTSKAVNNANDLIEELDDSNTSSVDITVDGDTYNIDTHNLSLNDIRDAINDESTLNDKVVASVVDNKLVITNKADDTHYAITAVENNIDIGLSSAVIQAQNLKATIDGISYDTSSNTINTQGDLSITASAIGDASITLARDTSSIETSINGFLTSYNELVDLVEDELGSADSPIADKTSLRSMMSSIKNQLFGYYGENKDQNLFQHGFTLDTTGHISIDSTKFSDSISNNYDALKTLFVGTAANEGLGTQLKTYIDGLDAYEGLLSNYDESMKARHETLTTEQEDETKKLDDKYAQMSMQFASYGAIISQMEAQFGGMKMMIEQSTSSN